MANKPTDRFTVSTFSSQNALGIFEVLGKGVEKNDLGSGEAKAFRYNTCRRIPLLCIHRAFTRFPRRDGGKIEISRY